MHPKDFGKVIEYFAENKVEPQTFGELWEVDTFYTLAVERQRQRSKSPSSLTKYEPSIPYRFGMSKTQSTES